MDHADRGRAGRDAVNKSVGKPVNECVDNPVDNVRGVGRRMNVGSRPHRDSGLNVGGGLSMDRGLNVDGGLNMDRGPNVDGGLNMDPGLNLDGGLNTDRGQNTGRVLILDGGMGRELLRRGAPFRQPEWSALALTEAPEAVRDAHLDFIRAGAEVITANSYAVVPFHIGDRFELEAQTLAATAGRLAREAATQSGRDVKVAGSLPPLFGSYRPDLFEAARAPMLAAPLVAGLAPYVDIWLAETISSLAEARTWREVLPNDGKPFWLSFTLDDAVPHEVPVLRSGETVAEAARLALDLGAAALLFNCSAPEIMEAAVRVAREICGDRLRLGVYANALVTEDNNSDDANGELSGVREDTQPEAYLRWAQTWVAAGADMVGGCCGIGPEHIRELAQHLG